MGHVVFIGAGPGAADLITLRGVNRLAQAEVVLFDALTDPALREFAPGAHIRVSPRCSPPRDAITAAPLPTTLVSWRVPGLMRPAGWPT